MSAATAVFGLVGQPVPAIAVELQASPTAVDKRQDRPLNQSALSLRALRVHKAYSPRLKILTERLTISRPPAAEHSTVRRARELALLHEASVRSLRYIELFTRFGVMPAPFVKDSTGRFGDGRPIDQALAAVKSQPHVLAVVDWSGHGDPMRLLESIFGNQSRSDRLSEKVARLRESVRGIEVVWLVEVDRKAPLPGGLRRAMSATHAFQKQLREVEANIDPSLALVVESNPSRYPHERAGRLQRLAWLVESLTEEAEDIALLELDWPRSRALYEGVERFVRDLLKQANDSEERSAIASLYATAMDRREASRPTPTTLVQGVPLENPMDERAIELRAWAAKDDTLRLEVPGGEAYLESPDGATNMMAFAQTPGETARWQAPWLHAAQVDIESHDSAFWSAAGEIKPIVVSLTHESSGRRHLRRLRPDSDHDPEVAWNMQARFMDLEEGVYRLEILPPSGTVQRSANHPDDPGPAKPDNRTLSWRRLAGWPMWRQGSIVRLFRNSLYNIGRTGRRKSWSGAISGGRPGRLSVNLRAAA